MDPYQTLGVPPSATPAEVEAAYRRLLRAWHPDVHASRGDAAVAEAEARTRQLNEAIAHVRAGWRPAGTGGRTWYDEWGNAHGAHEVDWFRASGAPEDEAQAVPCPFCGTPFDSLADYRAHLAARHRVRDIRPSAEGPGGVVRALAVLRWVPVWLAAIVALATMWVAPAAFIAGLAFVALVLWVQTSPRFRHVR